MHKTWARGLVALAAATALQAGAAPAPDGVDVISRTTHHGRFGGKPVDYVASVERSTVTLSPGGPAARLVSISYVATNAKNAAQRPVIFLFNGGPNSPAIFLQMLAFGPKRLAVPADLAADPATFKTVDNGYTVLDAADLVFFDPAGTGFSKAADGSQPGQFFSVDADAMELTRFIQQWSASHGRTDSPKYLLGESYGTLRAATAARQLGELQPAVRLDGVILMGQALNIVETVQRPGNIMSYVASLPTLATLGWYHGKVDRQGRGFEAFLDEARRFARDEYLPALFKGADLDDQDRQHIAQRLADLTGVAKERQLALNLRMTRMQFRKELLADRGLVLGANDGRYVGAPTADDPLPDASERIVPAVVAHFGRYLRDDLKVALPDPYVTDSPIQGLGDWRWGATSPFGDWPYMRPIKDAMAANPALRVAVGVGYEDMLTTTGAAEYAIAQSGWPRDRVSIRYYEGGHMTYTVEDSLRRITDDVRAFVTPPRP
jgi:carboxypeptidase C (cathepsin A)